MSARGWVSGTGGALFYAMKPVYELTECPVCGASDTAEVADQVAIQDEVAWLWEFHTRRMQPTADPRDLTDRVAFSQAPPLRVAQCSVCTHIFRNPRERGVTSIYGGEQVDVDTFEALFQAQRHTFTKQVERLTSLMPSRGSGLEVGSYVGAFLDAARDAGWHFEGCDVNPEAVAFARDRKLTAHVGSIGDVDPDSKYDVIAIWNCFEQLADVRAAIRDAHARMRVNGILTIRVPNAGYWAALRSRLRGPLRHAVTAALAQNNLLSLPYRNGFTFLSLRTLCERNGFDAVKSYGEFSLPVTNAGAPGWAMLEGRAVHAAVRALSPVTGAPWIELYARKRAT